MFSRVTTVAIPLSGALCKAPVPGPVHLPVTAALAPPSPQLWTVAAFLSIPSTDRLGETSQDSWPMANT